MSFEGVREMLKGIRKARGLVAGETTLKEVEPLLVPKITVEGFVEGAIVELISGPFKGEKARVKKIDQAKEEITVELIEAVVPIPVTVRGDHVRMLEKGGGKVADEVSVLVEGGKAAAGAAARPGPRSARGQRRSGRGQDQRGDEAVRRDARPGHRPGRSRDPPVHPRRRPPAGRRAPLEGGREGERLRARRRPRRSGTSRSRRSARSRRRRASDLFGRSIEEKVNQVIGTCVSLGLTVDGQDPRAAPQGRVAARGARMMGPGGPAAGPLERRDRRLHGRRGRRPRSASSSRTARSSRSASRS